MKRVFLIGTLLMLSACAGGNGIAHQCQSLGYAPGTDGFLNCYNSMVAEDQHNRDRYADLTKVGVGITQPRPMVTCSTFANTTTCR